MTDTIILDGKKLAQKLNQQLKNQINNISLEERPCLAVCIVGENPASQVYVKKKHQTAKELGLKSQIIELPENIQQEELLQQIQNLNNNPKIHGILLQLPLPRHLYEEPIITAINPLKDVDGLHSVNLGRIIINQPQLIPCTPAGIMELLLEYQINLTGMNALIIGRSRLVGKPIAQLLLNQSATVTIAHSKTPIEELKEYIAKSDLIIVAIGQAEYFKGEWLKKESILIDVGINRICKNNKIILVGDIDYNSCYSKAKAITPVPGGIGPLTVACLMQNTLHAWKLQQNN